MEIKGKVAFVTGGTGFIGSALVRELLERGARVVVYDNFVTGDPINLKEVLASITLLKGDILAPDLHVLLSDYHVDIVFNLAAEPYIPHCYERPARFFEVNANGTMNVLLAAKQAGVKRILQYSSSEVYGTARYVPMDEAHPTLPCSTYAVSKLAADRLCFTLFHEQQIPVIILRQFNTYGPRETHPYIIPELITQLLNDNHLKLGNYRARRDFTYIEDAVRGAVALMACDEAMGQTVNLGSGRDWSVEELARVIARLMGWSDIHIEMEEARLRPFDVEQLQCNFFRAYQLIRWEPRIPLEDGLKKTIEWYQTNGNRWVWEQKIAPEDKLWKST